MVNPVESILRLSLIKHISSLLSPLMYSIGIGLNFFPSTYLVWGAGLVNTDRDLWRNKLGPIINEFGDATKLKQLSSKAEVEREINVAGKDE